MNIILPTGLGFLLGQIFTPKPNLYDHVEEHNDQDTAEDTSKNDSLPTAA